MFVEVVILRSLGNSNHPVAAKIFRMCCDLDDTFS